MTITTRSRIAIRYTTNPADMGYDGRPSEWKKSKPEMMSLKGALRFAYELSQKIGHGTYKIISYTHKGNDISLDEIRDCLDRAEHKKNNNR